MRNDSVRRSGRRGRRPGWNLSAALLFAGLALLFYLPQLLGLATFPDGDFTHHFLPFSLFQQQEMLSSRLPVWNPYTYGGHPFLADIQAAVFYPISNLLLFLTLPWTAPGARLYFLQIEAMLQVAMAGLFTWLLVRDLTGRRWAAFIAGAIFAFSGYLTGYPPLQLAVLRTAIWLPLLLWLLMRGVATPRQWRWWIGGGVALAVAFFGGHAQTFLFVLYAVATWILLLLVWRLLALRRQAGGFGGDNRHCPLAIAAGLLAFGLVAAGVAAAQALPGLEFAQLSVRAQVDYAYVSGGFPLQDTWQLLLPGVLTLYSPLYVGVVGLGLAWLGLFAYWPAGRAQAASPQASRTVHGHLYLPSTYSVPFFALLALIALSLAYGANGLLYPLFHQFMPGWNLFRGQERAAYLVAFGLSVLAGHGVAAIPQLRGRRRSLLATVYAALVIAGTYIFGLLWQFPGRTAIGNGAYLVVAAVTVTLVAIFAVMLRWPGWSRQRSFWLAALVAGNLFWANVGTNLAEFSLARKTILPPEVEALQAATAQADSGLPGRAYNEFRVYEDYGMRAGVEDVWGASPLRLARYAALFAEFPLDRMWQMLGVEHVLTWRRALFRPSELLGEWPQATDTTYLHRLPAPGPRARVVGAVQPATDEEAVRLLADHAFDLGATALLPPDVDSPGAPAAQPAPVSATVQITQVAPGHLAVQVAGDGGLLVVAENWMPGWRVEAIRCMNPATDCSLGDVEILGLPSFAPVRADLTLTGVPVPPGEVAFDLVYRPDSVRHGLWIAGATVGILAAALAVRWRVRRSRRVRTATVRI